ncbi:hypothetical protein ACWGKQ_11005 [Streptomyces sp. NPDC054770]
MTPTHQPGARPPGTDRTVPGDPPRTRRIRRAAAMPLHDGDPDGTAASAALAHAQAVAAGVAARAAVTAVAEEPPAESRPDVVGRLRRTGATARGFRPDPGGDQPGPVTRGARPKSGPWPLVAAAAVAGAVLVSVPLAHKGEKQTTDVEGLDRVTPVATSGTGDLASDGDSSPVPYATPQPGAQSPAQGSTPAPSESGSRTPHASPGPHATPHAARDKAATATPSAAPHQHASPRTSPSESRTPRVPWAEAVLEEPDDQASGTDEPADSLPPHLSKAAEDSATTGSATTDSAPRTDATPARPRATAEKQTVHGTATAAHKRAVETRPAEKKHAAEEPKAVEKPEAVEKPKAAAKPEAGARPTVAAAPHQWETRVVNATTVLSAGQSVSTDHVRLAMTASGNLVITDTDGRVLWSAGTSGAGNRAVFQADGNFVVYGSADQTLWTAGTAGNNGAELVLQADGNVTVLATSGTVVWASGTVH